MKYIKNGNSYHVGPIGFTLDDLGRLKVKATNGAVTAIGMWGYTPVGLTGVLVAFCSKLTAKKLKKQTKAKLHHGSEHVHALKLLQQ